MTWVGEFRPGNKTIYTVFDEESDFQVKNKHVLRPEGKNKEKRNFKNLCFNLLNKIFQKKEEENDRSKDICFRICLISFFISFPFWL